MEAFVLGEETWTIDEFNEFRAFETLVYFEKTVVQVAQEDAEQQFAQPQEYWVLLETEEREPNGVTVSSHITNSLIAYFAVVNCIVIDILNHNVVEKVLAFLASYVYLVVKHYDQKEVEEVVPSNFVELSQLLMRQMILTSDSWVKN